jgi:imidazole glycerol-phosphate synthase subunit HisH
MKIAVVKYNAGNIQSVLFALERLGHQAVWTDDPVTLRNADRVIFPGVGEASSAMRYLRQNGLDEVIRGLQQPVLGICLGLQLFCAYSSENDTECLGIFKGKVCLFDGKDTENAPNAELRLKVPHIGWNNITALRGPLFNGIEDQTWAYFVHGYYAETCAETCAETGYGTRFSAGLQRDNFYAVQFHPEKSGAAGQRILANFIAET